MNQYLEDALQGGMMSDFQVRRNPSDFYRWKNYYLTTVFHRDVMIAEVMTNDLECDATIISIALAMTKPV
jgi:hypothetical protein